MSAKYSLRSRGGSQLHLPSHNRWYWNRPPTDFLQDASSVGIISGRPGQYFVLPAGHTDYWRLSLTKLLLALNLAALSATSLSAGVIFSDFSPASNNVGTLGSGGRPAWASAFTSSDTEQLSQVKVALGSLSGTAAATVQILNDASGVPGASVLESWSLTGIPTISGGTQTLPVETLLDATNLVLNGGTKYWLAIFQPDSGSSLYFQDTTPPNNPSPVFGGNPLNGTFNGTWTGPFAASLSFEVDGTPAAAPEPASLALLGSALAGLGGLLARKNRSN